MVLFFDRLINLGHELVTTGSCRKNLGYFLLKYFMLVILIFLFVKVREEILLLLQNTLNAHGSSSLTVSKFIPSITNLLSDSQVALFYIYMVFLQCFFCR